MVRGISRKASDILDVFDDWRRNKDWSNENWTDTPWLAPHEKGGVYINGVVAMIDLDYRSAYLIEVGDQSARSGDTVLAYLAVAYYPGDPRESERPAPVRKHQWYEDATTLPFFDVRGYERMWEAIAWFHSWAREKIEEYDAR